MNFLNSTILVGLAAAILPLVIHLLTKSKAKPIAFSSLRFLRRLQNDKIKRLKLRQIILLLIRTLIILSLVLAFARPTCRRGATAVGGDAKTSAVIVLDNSASMGRIFHGKTFFERAQTAAGEVLSNYKLGDEIFLLTATDTTLQINKNAFYDFASLRRRINEITIDTRRTDLNAALHQARNILASCDNLNKEIIIISDLQRTAFPINDTLDLSSSFPRIYALPIVGEVQNLSIVSARLMSTILQKGKVVELAVKISNQTKNVIKNRLVEIFLNEQRVAQKTVEVAAESESEEVFRFVLDRGGFLAGRIVLEDDDCLYDNERYFTLSVPEKINIGLFRPSAMPTDHFLLALQPNVMSSFPFAIVQLPEQLSTQLLDSLQVVVFNNVQNISSQSVAKLASFVEQGGGLLLILGSGIDLQWYNEVFNPLMALPRLSGWLGGDGTSFTIDKIDLTHPLFSGIFERENAHFTKPLFYSALRINPDAYVHTIISFSSGDPYLFEARKGQGTILVFTSAFSPQQSDIMYRAIFAPLMHRCAVYLGTRSQNQQEDWLIGQAYRLRLPGHLFVTHLQVARPDGEKDRVPLVVTHSGAWVHYAETNLPGHYRLFTDEEAIAQWAVNLDAREFDFRMIEEGDLAKRYHLQIVRSTEELQRQLQVHRVGKELWNYFILAAFLMLILEMLFYREKKEVMATAEDMSG